MLINDNCEIKQYEINLNQTSNSHNINTEDINFAKIKKIYKYFLRTDYTC